MSEHKKNNNEQPVTRFSAHDQATVEQLLENTKPKNDKEKFAEDLVYTLNHAIVCATSDFADPLIGAWTQKHLGKKLVLNPLHAWAHDKFEHHDHDHHDHHDHDHHHGGSFWGNLGHWVVGEAVGDVGAVPFTLAMQYYTPGVMRGIQNLAEPVLGKTFRWSADRYARHWAEENGFDANSPEARARADELYQHEVSHIPHAFVWTGSAAALNILTQKYITHNKAPTMHIVYGKALGSLGTLGLVLGLRTLAPNKIQQLDEWNTKNLAEPITRRTAKLLGIGEDTVERVLDHQREFADGHHIKENSQKHSEHEEGGHKEGKKSKHPESKVQTHGANLLPPLDITRLIG